MQVALNFAIYSKAEKWFAANYLLIATVCAGGIPQNILLYCWAIQHVSLIFKGSSQGHHMAIDSLQTWMQFVTRAGSPVEQMVFIFQCQGCWWHLARRHLCYWWCCHSQPVSPGAAFFSLFYLATRAQRVSFLELQDLLKHLDLSPSTSLRKGKGDSRGAGAWVLVPGQGA